MSLYVDIEKRMGNFLLQVQFQAGQESLALLGASGCGKSVTLKCVAGILTPDQGRITLDGVTLFDSAAKIDLPPQRRRVGYLFQQYALFPNMTVRQNIAAAIRDRKARASVAADKLRQFQLEAVANLRPAQLSGGQQQRCALARILASEPGAILLDEPFSALDSYLKFQLEWELWETLSAFPGPVIWVSHDRGEVLRNCPRVCVMDQGRSQAVRPMAELMARPGTVAAARLSGCENFAHALPEGETVYLPQWGVRFSCGRAVPDGVCAVGIRARRLHPAQEGAVNAFSCRVIRVVEDVSARRVLLRPEGAPPESTPVCWETGRDSCPIPENGRVTVAVDTDHILLLTSR